MATDKEIHYDRICHLNVGWLLEYTLITTKDKNYFIWVFTDLTYSQVKWCIKLSLCSQRKKHLKSQRPPKKLQKVVHVRGLGVLVVRGCWLRPLPEDKKAAQTKWSHLPLKEATGPERKANKNVSPRYKQTKSAWSCHASQMICKLLC